MTKKWSEVAASDAFKSLSPDQQDGARRQYFDQVVAPQVPAEHVDRVWGDFSRDAGVGRRELPSGVTPSSAGAGRGTTVPTQPPVSLANSLPRAQETKALTRAQRIAEMERENDPTNPDYLPVTDNAVKALQTGARGDMDAKRTRTPGRVLDADIPPVSAKSVAQDVAAGALKIGPTVVKSVGDIARLASGDRVGKGITEFADRGTQAIQDLVASDRSTAQQTRFQQDMADPAMNPADVVVANPGALSDQVLPTLGSMALPVGVGAAAGKLATTSRAAQLARVIDEASVINRANTVRNAAVLGATVAQNAAGTFSDIRDDGGDLGEAYTGAAVTVPATVIASKLTGGGAEGNASNMLAGTARGAAKEIPKAMLKEGAQEVVEEGGQYAGETIGKGEQFDANAAGKRLAVAGTLGAVMGGGVEAAGAARSARENRIKALRDAGETAAADLLQQKHEKANAAEAVDAELSALPGNEGFAQQYRTLRTAGVKPAEAAARSAVSVTFQGLAQQTGVPDKALQAAMTAAKDMPLDKVPGFFQRFTEGLAKRGLIQPTETLTAIGSSLETARDEAMDAAIGVAYQPVKATMDAVQALEQGQNTPVGTADIAQSATEVIANADQQKAGASEGKAAPAQAPTAVGGDATGTGGLPGTGSPAVQTTGVDGGRTTMYRPDMQTGQLLRLANLETASEADRQAAKDEVKRREVDAMYAGLETKPDERAQQEQAILEAARDEKVDQAVALTSAQEVDAPSAMQLAFNRAKAADALKKAANEAATSPLNDLPEPTQAQKEAGNYKVGRVTLQGLNISIENPQGSVRKGTSPDGKAWENTLAAHYGYIRGTEGNDGDHVDTFIGPNPDSQKVFVVDQVNEDGSFDEHKVMLGADTLEQADKLYHDNYHAGWTGRGAITEMSMPDFKKWVKDGIKTQPVGALPKADKGTAQVDAATEVQPAAGGNAAAPVGPVYLGRDNTPLSEGGKPFKTRKAADDARKLNTMMRVVSTQGGYALTEKTPAQLAAQEKAAKRLRNPQTSAPGEPIPAHAMIAAAGGLASSTRADMGMQGNVQIGNRRLFAGEGKGLSIERATERLVEEGYLPEGASHDNARDLIKRSLTKPQYNAEGYERLAELDSMERFDSAQLDEDEAVAEIEALSDNQFDAMLDADIPWDTASNTDTESAMRALGFTEQEIQDAITNQLGEPQDGSASRGGLDEGTASQAQADSGSREETAPEPEQVSTQQTPAPAGVSVSGFDIAKRADGTLAVKGDAAAIREALKGIPAASLSPMRGGILVGRTQADKAMAILQPEGLTAPTKEEVVAQQDRAAQTAKAKESADRAAEKQAREAEDRKRIAQASEAAADSFELGGDAMANLTGQKDIFASEPVGKQEPVKIEDAGEKIGGARKDRWKDRGLDLTDLDSMSEAEGAELATKANVWKPDYEAMAEATEPVTAAMVKTVYDQLAAQPKKNTPEGRRNYVTMMQAVRKAYSEAKSPEDVKQAGEKLKRAIGLYTDDSEQKKQAREVLFSVYKGRSDPFVLGYTELSKAKKMVEDGFPAKGEPWKKRLSLRAYTAAGFTPRGIEITLDESAELGTPLTKEQVAAGFYRINTKDGKAVGYAPTKADAEATAKTIYERDLKKGADSKAEPNRPNLDAMKREGLPKRTDRDVSAEDFVKDFGFRGVEFGNWAAQDERQRIINMAYDGLMDLAEIMGVPPKAMSLNGTMGMAFGARGGGKFAAHYEPGKLVINMTKINGGGSLAHEWAHALDHYFGELNQKDAYTTKARGASGWMDEQQYKGLPMTRMEKDAQGKWAKVTKMRLDNLRPEMSKAFDGVMSALFSGQETKAQMVRSEELAIERYKALADKETDPEMKAVYLNGIKSRQQALEELRKDPEDKTYPKGRSSYAGEAQKLVGKSSTGYWTRPTEMFARAFESWVFDKVAAMGAKSDYLVHGVEEDRFAGGGYKGNPYPTGQERATINAAFDNLASTIQTKETEKGVAMFALGAEAFSLGITPRKYMPVTAVQAAVDELSAKWTNGPEIKVVQYPEDLPVAAPSDARGLIHKGTAYVVAVNHLDRAGVARTLAHEAIGHYGLWKALGKEGRRQFEQNLQLALKSGNKPLTALAARVRELYVDDAGKFNLSPAEEANEIAAFAVEEALDADGNFNPGFGFFKQVWAKVADFLRGLGIDVKFTNAELQGMLVSSLRGLESGQRLNGGGEVMVAAARGAAPAPTSATVWNTPDPTRTDKIIYELQDGRIDLKRVQQAIEKSGQQIEEQWDARLAETLYPGRVAHRSQSFLDAEVKPLLKALTVYKVPMDELADYLHARGAEERNAQVAKVNDELPDGGAGKNTKGVLMTNQAARDYLAGITPARKQVLDALAAKVDTITAGTRKLLVDEGLEKQETIDAWTSTYKNYVPMFRDEAQSGAPHPQGSGFTVKGSASKRATGSTKEVTNILAHVLMQREAAITRAEKNRVALSLYGQALSHPNREFWTTIKPSMAPASIVKELQAMGIDPATAATGMETVPTITTVDPTTGKKVDRPNPLYKSLPGAIPLKVNGEDRVLMINVEQERGARLAENLKNLDGLTKLDLANSIIGKSTRWLASVNTQYNPAFGLVNLTRDTLGAVVNLGSTQLRGNSLKVLANTPVAITGIAKELMGSGKGKWSTLYRQFQEDGGQTGYKENFRDAGDRAKAIESELASLKRAGTLHPGRAAHAMLDLLDGFNTTLENAVRVSAYAAALDKGMSRPEAARLGRELTVDFNRKGRAGREVGPLYAFFNASVQGSARTLETLKGPTGAKVIAGGLGLGALQALMLLAAGYDDDEVPEFVKTRALVIPLNWTGEGEKTHVLVPYPLGLHVIPNTGRVISELTLNGGKELGKRTGDAIGELAGAFNPLGGGNIFTTDGLLKTLAPTLADPVIEIGYNRNFAGNSIERESTGIADTRPGTARAKEATQRSTTGQAYIGISKAINSMTGGTDYQAGAMSPTPERIRYIAQTVGGGVLREVEKTINASTAASRGEPVKSSAIPVVGRFYGEVNSSDVTKSRYFENAKRLDQLESTKRSMIKDGNADALAAFNAAHPEMALIQLGNKVQSSVEKLNKLAVSTIGDVKTMQELDASRVEIMDLLNQAVEGLEKETEKPTLGEKVKGWKKDPVN